MPSTAHTLHCALLSLALLLSACQPQSSSPSPAALPTTQPSDDRGKSPSFPCPPARDTGWIRFSPREFAMFAAGAEDPRDSLHLRQVALATGLWRMCVSHDKATFYDTLPSGAVIGGVITRKPFGRSAHRLGFAEDGKALLTIDGKPFYGTDLGLPSLALDSLHITVDGQAIKIPPAAYKDLYQPGICPFTCETSIGFRLLYVPDSPYFYLRGGGGDGAGTYEVIWVFRGREYLCRFLVSGF